LTNLNLDGHPHYSLADGTRAFTGDVDIEAPTGATGEDRSLSIWSGDDSGDLAYLVFGVSPSTEQWRIQSEKAGSLEVIEAAANTIIKVEPGARVSGSPQLYLEQSSEVGINTDTPLAMLDVNGDVLVRGELEAKSGDVDNVIIANSGSSSSFESAFVLQDQSTLVWSVVKKADGNLALRGNNSNNEPFLIEDQAPTDSIVVVSGGNVGIGQPLPAAKLDVNGTIKLSDIHLVGGGSVGGDLTCFGTYEAFVVRSNSSLQLPNETITDGGSKSINVFEATVPVSTVLPFAASVVPAGYLECGGQAVSRTTYADLFAAISTTYGIGDGATTFNVPNLEGSVPAGLQIGDPDFGSLGQAGGAKTHSLSEAEMPAHQHAGFGESTSGWPFGDSGTAGKMGSAGAVSFDNLYYNTSFTGGGQVYPGTGPAGPGEAHNNLQPYITLRYIIKT
jgi:microcystin-dependent protein